MPELRKSGALPHFEHADASACPMCGVPGLLGASISGRSMQVSRPAVCRSERVLQVFRQWREGILHAGPSYLKQTAYLRCGAARISDRRRRTQGIENTVLFSSASRTIGVIQATISNEPAWSSRPVNILLARARSLSRAIPLASLFDPRPLHDPALR